MVSAEYMDRFGLLANHDGLIFQAQMHAHHP